MQNNCRLPPISARHMAGLVRHVTILDDNNTRWGECMGHVCDMYATLTRHPHDILRVIARTGLCSSTSIRVHATLYESQTSLLDCLSRLQDISTSSGDTIKAGMSCAPVHCPDNVHPLIIMQWSRACQINNNYTVYTIIWSILHGHSISSWYTKHVHHKQSVLLYTTYSPYAHILT